MIFSSSKNSLTINTVLLIFISLTVALVSANISEIKISNLGWLDPIMYYSYSQDFANLVSRYGPTYYSKRLVHIIPQMLFYKSFGITLGFYIYKVFLLFVFYLCIYGIIRLVKDTFTSHLTALTATTSPIILASVSWDHYDGTVAVLLTLLFYIALSQHTKGYYSKLSLLSIGVVWTFITNGNLWAGGLALSALSLLLMLNFFHNRNLTKTFAIIGYFAAGFLISYGTLVLAYGSLTVTGPDFVNNAARSLTYLDMFSLKWVWDMTKSGSVSNWNTDVIGAIFDGSYRYFFILSLVPIALVNIARRSTTSISNNVEKVVSTTFLMFVILYFGYQEFFSASVLSLHYYVVYLLPLTYLVLFFGLDLSRNKIIITALIVIPQIFYWSNLSDQVPKSSLQWIKHVTFIDFNAVEPNDALIGAVTYLLLLSLILFFMLDKATDDRNNRVFQKINSILLALFIGTFCFHLEAQKSANNGHYNFNRVSTTDGVKNEEDHRAAINWLNENIRSVIPNAGDKIGFIYASKPCAPQSEVFCPNTLQSSHLWGYSLVKRSAFGNKLVLAKSDKKRINEMDHIIALSYDNELDHLPVNFKEIGIKIEKSDRYHFIGQVLDFKAVIYTIGNK